MSALNISACFSRNYRWQRRYVVTGDRRAAAINRWSARANGPTRCTLTRLNYTPVAPNWNITHSVYTQVFWSSSCRNCPGFRVQGACLKLLIRFIDNSVMTSSLIKTSGISGD